jgi:CubicO group peptidase (beta-lactamase class C family)
MPEVDALDLTARVEEILNRHAAIGLAMGVVRNGHLEWVTSGASSIYSTLNDMARYVAALVGGGANSRGRVLKPATLATMFQPHYQTDPSVPGIGQRNLNWNRAEESR